jgi:hypothetical protein
MFSNDTFTIATFLLEKFIDEDLWIIEVANADNISEIFIIVIEQLNLHACNVGFKYKS